MASRKYHGGHVHTKGFPMQLRHVFQRSAGQQSCGLVGFWSYFRFTQRNLISLVSTNNPATIENHHGNCCYRWYLMINNLFNGHEITWNNHLAIEKLISSPNVFTRRVGPACFATFWTSMASSSHRLQKTATWLLLQVLNRILLAVKLDEIGRFSK